MFNMTEKEKLAYLIAKKAHQGQVDKAGVDYINHPLMVASKLDDEKLRIIALLHDTVEDSDVTLEYLAKYFDQDIVEAIDAMTHRENEDYETYLRRLKKNPLAFKVKLKDIEHNTDLSRFKNPTKEDYLHIGKYYYALQILFEDED